MELKGPPGSSGPTSKKAPWENQEVTKFHMSFYDMERMDRYLFDAHNFLFKAETTPNWEDITGAVIAMKHAYTVFKYAYSSRSRELLTKKVKKLDKLRLDIQAEVKPYEKIDAKLIHEVIETLWEELDGIYQAKQEAGLGIPKVRYTGALARIRRAIRS